MDAGGGGSDLEFDAASLSPPRCVSISSFSPHSSPGPALCLSSCISEASRLAPASRRKLAWVSLQGCLVGAEEASSAKTIGGSLGLRESFAWDLFSPLQRVLVVAIAAAAAADGEKSRQISQLQKSVDIRDMVLATMQQKLDDLCDQMNGLNDGARDCGGRLFATYDEYSEDERLDADGGKINICGQAYMLNPPGKDIPIEADSPVDRFHCSASQASRTNSGEPEERRMSDLSYCSSVASSVDIQLSTLAVEQDLYNLRRECEEKNEFIKELTASSNASSLSSSKRISDLEEMLRRKNMVINKMKKDMLILEQKLIQFMRQQRPSSAASSSSSEMKLPVMATNLLYDMSSSSPSSDSDSSSDSSERHSWTFAAHELWLPPTRESCPDGSDLIRGTFSEGQQKRASRRRWF